MNMNEMLSCEKCEELADKLYGEGEAYSVEYAEGFGGNDINIFTDEKMQDIYDTKFKDSNEIYNHVVIIIPDKEDIHDESEWRAVYIIHAIDKGNVIAFLTPWEDNDMMLKYEFWEA